MEPYSTVTVLMAAGYGKIVNELDSRTDTAATEVSFGELVEITCSSEEWFDDLRASIGGSLGFGVLDSSSLFVEGQPDTVTRRACHAWR